jgi:hypothetical protein
VPRAQPPRTQRKKTEPATTRAFLFSDLRTGFAANSHRAVIVCIRVATERGLALGTEWASVSARAREFAQRAGAKWWLEVLEKAGL